MFEITGTLSRVFEAQTFGQSFTKREFVINVQSGEDMQQIKFECHMDHAKLLEGLSEGNLLAVEFRITGREWKGTIYNNLVCFGIQNKTAPKAAEEEPAISDTTEAPGNAVDEEPPF